MALRTSDSDDEALSLQAPRYFECMGSRNPSEQTCDADIGKRRKAWIMKYRADPTNRARERLRDKESRHRRRADPVKKSEEMRRREERRIAQLEANVLETTMFEVPKPEKGFINIATDGLVMGDFEAVGVDERISEDNWETAKRNRIVNGVSTDVEG